MIHNVKIFVLLLFYFLQFCKSGVSFEMNIKPASGILFFCLFVDVNYLFICLAGCGNKKFRCHKSWTESGCDVFKFLNLSWDSPFLSELIFELKALSHSEPFSDRKVMQGSILH